MKIYTIILIIGMQLSTIGIQAEQQKNSWDIKNFEQRYEKICQNSDNLCIDQIQKNLNDMLIEIQVVLDNDLSWIEDFLYTSINVNAIYFVISSMVRSFRSKLYDISIDATSNLKDDTFFKLFGGDFISKSIDNMNKEKLSFQQPIDPTIWLSALFGTLSYIGLIIHTEKLKNQRILLKDLKMKITTKLQEI